MLGVRWLEVGESRISAQASSLFFTTGPAALSVPHPRVQDSTQSTDTNQAVLSHLGALLLSLLIQFLQFWTSMPVAIVSKEESWFQRGLAK